MPSEFQSEKCGGAIERAFGRCLAHGLPLTGPVIDGLLPDCGHIPKNNLWASAICSGESVNRCGLCCARLL